MQPMVSAGAFVNGADLLRVRADADDQHHATERSACSLPQLGDLRQGPGLLLHA